MRARLSAWAQQAAEAIHHARGLRPCVVMVNESIIYEREVWARDEAEAVRAACTLLQQGRTRGWSEVGRALRNVRTRRL